MAQNNILLIVCIVAAILVLVYLCSGGSNKFCPRCEKLTAKTKCPACNWDTLDPLVKSKINDFIAAISPIDLVIPENKLSANMVKDIFSVNKKVVLLISSESLQDLSNNLITSLGGKRKPSQPISIYPIDPISKNRVMLTKTDTYNVVLLGSDIKSSYAKSYKTFNDAWGPFNKLLRKEYKTDLFTTAYFAF